MGMCEQFLFFPLTRSYCELFPDLSFLPSPFLRPPKHAQVTLEGGGLGCEKDLQIRKPVLVPWAGISLRNCLASAAFHPGRSRVACTKAIWHHSPGALNGYTSHWVRALGAAGSAFFPSSQPAANPCWYLSPRPLHSGLGQSTP